MLIDSAKTSTLEGAATTVYATGGRGNTRLLTWEGEKTLTFTVEDALLSPIGFSVLSGANLFDYEDQPVHVNRTVRTGLTTGGNVSTTEYTNLYQITRDTNGDPTGYELQGNLTSDEIKTLIQYSGKTSEPWGMSSPSPTDPLVDIQQIAESLGWPEYVYTQTSSYGSTGCIIDLSDTLVDDLCADAPIFIDVLEDDSLNGDFMIVTSVSNKIITTDGKIYRYNSEGAKVEIDTITPSNVNDYVVLVNCYTKAKSESKAMELQINAEDFAGYFYVEADTLVRRTKDGRDLPAILTLPLVKIQSNFSIAMASSGDPSTFTFTMDAMPGYTYFNNKKKVLCTFQIIDEEAGATTRDAVMRHNADSTNNRRGDVLPQHYVHTGVYDDYEKSGETQYVTAVGKTIDEFE